MVAGCRCPQPSQRRYEILFDFNPHRDLAQAPVHRHDHTELRVEVVLQYRGAGVLQVEVGITPDRRRSYHLQSVARRHVLDDAGHVRGTHLAERKGAMAAVVEDQALLGIDGVTFGAALQ